MSNYALCSKAHKDQDSSISANDLHVDFIMAQTRRF